MLPALPDHPATNGARGGGFTLVEVLIVVVILGVLAAMVVPGMASARNDAAIATTVNEHLKIERAVDVYIAANDGSIPPVTAGDGTWGPIVSSAYLKQAPVNAYVGGANAKVISIGTAPDGAYQSTHGWIFDTSNGAVYAGSFDASTDPLPKP